MNINIHSINITTNIPTCMTTKDIQMATEDDMHLQDLKTYFLEAWASNRNDIKEDQNLSRAIKEALYIRVNNPSLNKNIGKFHLPHIWDEVLFNTSELKLK